MKPSLRASHSILLKENIRTVEGNLPICEYLLRSGGEGSGRQVIGDAGVTTNGALRAFNIAI